MTRPAERPYFLEGIEYLEILDGDGHYLQLPKLTTAQRDALSATEGMMIYNTDTNRVAVYQDGGWVEIQPWVITGTTLNFFMSDDAADIGSYYCMYPTESGDGYSELTSPSLSTGDDQFLWAFVTEAGEPGVEVLALGAYTTTLFLKKTGNKDVRVYWKLFKRDTGGTETEILQSAVSDYLTSDNSQYLISAYLNEDQVLDPTDRLVLKLYANVSGTGTDVTVTLTMEGDYDSRLTINVLSSAFNLDRLSDVTVSAPADNELLAYDSGSGKWINQTPGEAEILAADGSVPLSGDLNADGHSIIGLLSEAFAYTGGPIIIYTDPSSNKPVIKSIDPDGSTTGGIQEAIDALPDSGGKVLLPPGDITVSSTINITRNWVTIEGTVMGGTNAEEGSRIYAPFAGWVFNLGDEGTSTYLYGVQLKNFSIRGSGADTNGIYWYGYKDNCKIENIRMKSVGTGIYITNSWYGKPIQDVHITYCNKGIVLNYSNGLTIDNLNLNTFGYWTSNPGVTIQGLSRGNTIRGGTIEHGTGSSGHAIYLDNAPDTLIENVYVEANEGHDLVIDGGTDGVVVIGGYGFSDIDIISGNGIFMMDGDLVTTNGNIGCRTANPLSLLQVGEVNPGVGEPTYHGKIILQDESDGPEATGGIEFKASDYADGYGAKLYTNRTNDYFGIATRYASQTWIERFVIKESNGYIGMGTGDPGYNLDVSGDIHCTGKLTSDGGNDPPYVLYNYETRTSIIDRIKREVFPDKLNGAVLFYNGGEGRLELFLPNKGEFRSLDGQVLDIVEPITQTFETEDRYYLDSDTGEIKAYKVKKPCMRYRLKPDHELDPLTGKVKRKVKEKKKDLKTGKEIEEIIGEEEVAPEEAIELVEITKEDGGEKGWMR